MRAIIILLSDQGEGEAAAAASPPPEPTEPRRVNEGRSFIEFNYNGVSREGFIMGLEKGRFDQSLVRINEVWNTRDGNVDMPTGKLFDLDKMEGVRFIKPDPDEV